MNRHGFVQISQTPAAATSAGRMLQRKCACGNHTPVGGECDACARENTQLQRKTNRGVSFNEAVSFARASTGLPSQTVDASIDRSLKAASGTDLSLVRSIASVNPGRAAEAPAPNEPSRDEKAQAAPEAPIVAEAPGGPVPPTPASPSPPPEPLDKGPDAGPKPAPPATKIVTETVATTPADRARKTIGIGEEVKCSTDPATAATWSVTGGGAVSPAAGNSTTFTAKLGPSTSKVKATVGGTDITVDFDVVAPNGLKSTVKSNPGLGTKGPPNNQIGFETIFDCTVQPATVSFYNVKFRENIPVNNWTWPDKTAGSKGPTEVPWGVGYDNKTTDDVSTPLDPIARLSDGTKNVNFGYTIKVPEDYKDDAGTWVSWLPNEEHYKEFDATGKARGTLKATNNQSGTFQGPWQ